MYFIKHENNYIVRFYNRDCSHNRDMWCFRIMKSSKYHNRSSLPERQFCWSWLVNVVWLCKQQEHIYQSMSCIQACNSRRPGYECFTDCEMFLVIMFIVVLGYMKKMILILLIMFGSLIKLWITGFLLKVICLRMLWITSFK